MKPKPSKLLKRSRTMDQFLGGLWGRARRGAQLGKS